MDIKFNEMNNDKRIILAIALYAAVMTMVLHTLTSEGHQRYNVAEQHHFKYTGNEECTDDMVSTAPIVVCSENECIGTDEDNRADRISNFSEVNVTFSGSEKDIHS